MSLGSRFSSLHTATNSEAVVNSRFISLAPSVLAAEQPASAKQRPACNGVCDFEKGGVAGGMACKGAGGEAERAQRAHAIRASTRRLRCPGSRQVRNQPDR